MNIDDGSGSENSSELIVLIALILLGVIVFTAIIIGCYRCTRYRITVYKSKDNGYNNYNKDEKNKGNDKARGHPTVLMNESGEFFTSQSPASKTSFQSWNSESAMVEIARQQQEAWDLAKRQSANKKISNASIGSVGSIGSFGPAISVVSKDGDGANSAKTSINVNSVNDIELEIAEQIGKDIIYSEPDDRDGNGGNRNGNKHLDADYAINTEDISAEDSVEIRYKMPPKTDPNSKSAAKLESIVLEQEPEREGNNNGYNNGYNNGNNGNNGNGNSDVSKEDNGNGNGNACAKLSLIANEGGVTEGVWSIDVTNWRDWKVHEVIQWFTVNLMENKLSKDEVTPFMVEFSKHNITGAVLQQLQNNSKLIQRLKMQFENQNFAIWLIFQTALNALP